MKRSRILLYGALICIILVPVLCLIAAPRNVMYSWWFFFPIRTEVVLPLDETDLASRENLEAIRLHLAETTGAIFHDSSVGRVSQLAEERTFVRLVNHSPHSEVWNLYVTPANGNTVRIMMRPNM